MEKREEFFVKSFILVRSKSASPIYERIYSSEMWLKEATLKKTLLNNNIVAARAEQAMIDMLPVDQKTLRIMGKILEPKNLKRIGIAAVGGSVLISLVSSLGRDRINRAETARELKKQLLPLQKKLDELEAQNAALWRQNEELKEQLAKLESVYNGAR